MEEKEENEKYNDKAISNFNRYAISLGFYGRYI